MKAIIIPACGESLRWGGVNKLPVKVNEEPLIAESERRFAPYGKVTVFSHWPEVLAVCKNTIVPANHRWLAETILSSAPCWASDDVTIVAMGDVVWGEDSLRKLVADGNPSPFAIGHYSELYAFSFLPLQHQYVKDAMTTIVSYFAAGGEQRMAAVEARMPTYRALRGVPFETMPHPDPSSWENFYNITDFTVDIDTPDTLAEWRKMYAVEQANRCT